MTIPPLPPIPPMVPPSGALAGVALSRPTNVALSGVEYFWIWVFSIAYVAAFVFAGKMWDRWRDNRARLRREKLGK